MWDVGLLKYARNVSTPVRKRGGGEGGVKIWVGGWDGVTCENGSSHMRNNSVHVSVCCVYVLGVCVVCVCVGCVCGVCVCVCMMCVHGVYVVCVCMWCACVCV